MLMLCFACVLTRQFIYEKETKKEEISFKKLKPESYFQSKHTDKHSHLQLISETLEFEKYIQEKIAP